MQVVWEGEQVFAAPAGVCAGLDLVHMPIQQRTQRRHVGIQQCMQRHKRYRK